MEPATVSYLTRTGSVSAGGGGGGGTGESAELTEVKRALKSLKSQVDGQARRTASSSGIKSIADKTDDELTPEELAKRVANREKKAARKKVSSDEK